MRKVKVSSSGFDTSSSNLSNFTILPIWALEYCVYQEGTLSRTMGPNNSDVMCAVLVYFLHNQNAWRIAETVWNDMKACEISSTPRHTSTILHIDIMQPCIGNTTLWSNLEAQL